MKITILIEYMLVLLTIFNIYRIFKNKKVDNIALILSSILLLSTLSLGFYVDEPPLLFTIINFLLFIISASVLKYYFDIKTNPKTKKLKIFVCSPLRGDIETNITNTKNYCKSVANQGFIPFAPHIFCTQFLDDSIETERIQGINIGLEFLKICDEIWVIGDLFSEGMRTEIEFAKKYKIKIVYKKVEDILKFV